MMLALARQIPQANASTHAGKWEKSKFMGVELAGKTLGIVGCGNIGGIVADRARGLKMKVIAHDPYLSPERAEDLGVEKVDLDQLYARADFISLHAPATDATRGMINRAALAKMKRGVRIVNCARGALVIEADLKAAIESGQVAGAALDVFQQEPARGLPAVRHAAGGGDAAPRRLDDRGAGEGGPPGGRADGRLPAHRLGRQRAEHAVGQRRGDAAAAPLHAPGRTDRPLHGATGRKRDRLRHRRVRGSRRRAQPQAADRAGAGGAAVAADGDGEHGQRHHASPSRATSR